MKFLQICPKPPKPLIDGGCIAMNDLTSGLKNAGHNVSVFAMATEKHPFVEGVNSGDFNYEEISTAINPVSAFVNLVSNKSYNISRFHHSSAECAIENILRGEEYDFVILESLYSCPYIDTIRSNSKAQIILRAHNVEHQIWDSLASKTSNALKSWYLSKLTVQLEKFELSVLSDLDAVITMTDEDGEWFRKAGVKNLHTLPFSIDFKEPKRQSTFDHVFHLGSMDWMPNVEGVKWLLEEVWPLVREESSEARIVIAGRGMPPEFKSEPSMGVEVLGEVKSAVEFLDRPGIATVPILSGSGMRIKAIEAMAAELPVVGTELGLEGLGLENGKNALIANSPNDFAQAILDLLSDPSKASMIAKNGAKHINQNFNTNLVFKDLISFLKKIGKF